MTAVILVYITCKHTEEAQTLSELLLADKLIACSNIIEDMTSVFFWNDAVQKNKECLLICKTLNDRFKPIEKLVTEKHCYQVPCIMSIPVGNCSAAYEAWIKDCLS